MHVEKGPCGHYRAILEVRWTTGGISEFQGQCLDTEPEALIDGDQRLHAIAERYAKLTDEYAKGLH